MGKQELFCLLWCCLFGITIFLHEQTVASPPQTIFFYATVRDFLPTPCRAGNIAGNPSDSDLVRDTWCPNDRSIIQKVNDGILGGHPDFQRANSYNSANQPSSPGFTFEYNPLTGPVGPYYGKYANFGQQFPLAGIQTWLDPATYNSFTQRLALDDLVYDTTGIPKMQYCDGTTDGTKYNNPCDAAMSSRYAMNETTFNQWYQDSAFYNIRSGYQQPLYRQSTGEYQFNSADLSQESYCPDFFNPTDEYNLPSFPRSICEIVDMYSPYLSGCSSINGDCNYGKNRKFSFTSEIHTSFQYNGGEFLNFSGDDDVEVFINGRLAIDLGAPHPRAVAVINVTKYEQELNISKGNIYQFDLFQAERQEYLSNYGLTTTLSAACNVVTVGIRDPLNVTTAIDYNNGISTTQNSDWTVLAGPGFGILFANKTAALMIGGIPSVVSYMYLTEPQNVGSGFSLSFQFKMTGLGHGFAVVFQNSQQGITNLNGGTGPNLGIAGVNNSFAILFDMCPDYPESVECNVAHSELSIHYSLDGGPNSAGNATRTVYDPNVIQDWQDSTWHEALVFYYGGKPDWIEVYVDNSLRLVERSFDLEEILNSRNAYVGFTSASSEYSTLDVYISDVQMQIVKVIPQNTYSVEDPKTFPKILIANGEDPVSFTIQTRDACLNNLTFGGYSSQVYGKVISEDVSNVPPSSGRRLQSSTSYQEFPLEITDNLDGQYSIVFTTNVLANFSVYIGFGTNCTWTGDLKTGYNSSANCYSLVYQNAAQSIPFSTEAPTPQDETPSGLPESSLIGIGVAAGTILTCGSVMLIVGVRIRNRWRRDKRFVEDGMKVVAERGVEYTGDNELDLLQNKLQATLHAIQAERAKKLKDEDKQSVIDELLRQQGQLQEMVRRMKIQRDGGDPDVEASQQTFTNRFRKSFASSRVSRGLSVFNSDPSAAAPSSNTGGGGVLFSQLRKSIGGAGGHTNSNARVKSSTIFNRKSSSASSVGDNSKTRNVVVEQEFVVDNPRFDKQ